MAKEDHYKTASHGTGTRDDGLGGRVDVTTFRQKQKELIERAAQTGDLRLLDEAIRMDIVNITNLMNAGMLMYNYTAALDQMWSAWQAIRNHLGVLDSKCRPPHDPGYTGAASWTGQSAFATVKAPEEEGAEQQAAMEWYYAQQDPSFHGDGTYC